MAQVEADVANDHLERRIGNGALEGGTGRRDIGRPLVERDRRRVPLIDDGQCRRSVPGQAS
jgi:hypothetical protein